VKHERIEDEQGDAPGSQPGTHYEVIDSVELARRSSPRGELGSRARPQSRHRPDPSYPDRFRLCGRNVVSLLSPDEGTAFVCVSASIFVGAARNQNLRSTWSMERTFFEQRVTACVSAPQQHVPKT